MLAVVQGLGTFRSKPEASIKIVAFEVFRHVLHILKAGYVGDHASLQGLISQLCVTQVSEDSDDDPIKLAKLHLLFLIIFQISERAIRLKRLSEVRSLALDARNLKNL